MIEFIPQIGETRITAVARIRRSRRLPVPGEVSGSIGMRIGAQDVIARAYPPKSRRALSLTRVIGVTESQVPKRLLKRVGDPVEAREIIIAKPINFGVQRLVYRAPEAGQIAAIQGSWMILDVYAQPHDVPALYRGSIVAVEPRKGGTIEAQGALIQGVWGSSIPGQAAKEVVGVIKWVTREPFIDADILEADIRGAILVAAGNLTEAALKRAAELKVGGIISGSLLPELRILALTLPFPIVITEGFGSLTMGASTVELLSAVNGQEGALNAIYMPRGPNAARPELFVPLAASRMLQSEIHADNDRPRVAPKALVRGTCEPYLGRLGTLSGELWLQWVVTEAGTFLPAVSVEWQDTPGDRQDVPWTNLELIG